MWGTGCSCIEISTVGVALRPKQTNQTNKTINFQQFQTIFPQFFTTCSHVFFSNTAALQDDKFRLGRFLRKNLKLSRLALKAGVTCFYDRLFPTMVLKLVLMAEVAFPAAQWNLKTSILCCMMISHQGLSGALQQQRTRSKAAGTKMASHRIYLIKFHNFVLVKSILCKRRPTDPADTGVRWTHKHIIHYSHCTLSQ